MIFKYLFGGVPAMCIKNKQGQAGTYETTSMLVMMAKTDSVMHSDLKRWIEMIPLAGGFANWVGKDLKFYGESISCVVESFPAASRDATELLLKGATFTNQYAGYQVFLFCKEGCEPNLRGWKAVDRATVIVQLQEG